jgi:predicted DNA binding CopG/RHH family protein
MRKQYDFTDSKPNPYVKKLKRQVTIRLDEDSLEYFKSLAAEMEMPYQSLINSYLRECARTHKRPTVKWEERG